MDFPAFSSICSSNKAECGVNAGWKRCECQSFFCSSCRFVWGILCRWEDEESKGQRDKGTKSRRGKGTKRGRDEGTRRRKPRHLLFTSYSLPIHLLFVSSSPPLHLPIRSILIQFVSKNICEIRVQNSFTPENTASWEVGKGESRWQTVRVGGTGKEEAKWE